MKLIDTITSYFNKSSKEQRKETGSFNQKTEHNKADEINSIILSPKTVLLPENKQALIDYSLSRQGRKTYKVDIVASYSLAIQNILENHFLYTDNLQQGHTFKGHIMEISEAYSAKDHTRFNSIRNDAEKIENSEKKEYLLNAITQAEDYLSNSQKHWYLAFVDENHTIDFIGYMANFPNFKVSEINLEEYMNGSL